VILRLYKIILCSKICRVDRLHYLGSLDPWYPFVTNLRSLYRNKDRVYWLRAVPRPALSSGVMSEALPGITGFLYLEVKLVTSKGIPIYKITI
jgi:hypothetical protein